MHVMRDKSATYVWGRSPPRGRNLAAARKRGVHHQDEPNRDGQGGRPHAEALEGWHDIGHPVAERDPGRHRHEDPERRVAVEERESARDPLGGLGCCGGVQGCSYREWTMLELPQAEGRGSVSRFLLHPEGRNPGTILSPGSGPPFFSDFRWYRNKC